MSDNETASTGMQETQTNSGSNRKKRRVNREEDYKPASSAKNLVERSSPRPTRCRQNTKRFADFVSVSAAEDDDSEDDSDRKRRQKKRKTSYSPETSITENDMPFFSLTSANALDMLPIWTKPLAELLQMNTSESAASLTLSDGPIPETPTSSKKTSRKRNEEPALAKKRKSAPSSKTPTTGNERASSSSSSVKMSNLVLISTDPKIYWHMKSESKLEKEKHEGRDGPQNTRVEKLLDKIMSCEPQSGLNKAELSVERYSNLHSFFLILFKIPEGRTELRPDIENTIISNSPGVSFYHSIWVKSYSSDEGNEIWQLGDETPMESSDLKKIMNHICTGVRVALKVDGTMLELWQSLLLRCPRCISASSLSKALWKVKVFIEHTEYRKGATEREEEKKRKEEEKKKAEERILKEREEEAVVKGEMVLATLLMDIDEIVDTNKEWYYKLHAFFLYHFKFPVGRTVLRPDIGDPVVTNYPDWSRMHLVRSHTRVHGHKEIWQLGGETPMDSDLLKEITTHRCSGDRSLLYTRGTMLDLWHSLLLHCPDCTVMSSLSKAMRKVTRFIETECVRLRMENIGVFSTTS